MEIANWPRKIKASNYKEAHKKAMKIALERCPVKEYWGCHKADGILA